MKNQIATAKQRCFEQREELLRSYRPTSQDGEQLLRDAAELARTHDMLVELELAIAGEERVSEALANVVAKKDGLVADLVDRGVALS